MKRATIYGVSALAICAALACVEHLPIRMLARVAGVGVSLQEAGAPNPSRETVFYVSTQGNDAWSGKMAQPNSTGSDGPFRTLEAARNAIRELKKTGPLAHPVTVYIRGGLYRLRKTLVFTGEDSGTATCPITYEAYRGETAILSGAERITDWKRVKDKRLLSRAGGPLWMARVPKTKDGKWYFRELFVNGHRRQRARTPNGGFFHVEGAVSLQNPAWFKFRDGDIRPSWAKQSDVEVVVLQAWAELRMQIRSVDEVTHIVTLSGKAWPSNREKDARYWVENTLDALDAPGEWYLDRSSATLYYRPMPGEVMARVRVMAPILERLVYFKGDGPSGPVLHIRIRGLRLSYTDWTLGPTGYADLQAAYDIPAAVDAIGARSCSLEECVFKHLGGYAMEFGGGPRVPGGVRVGSKGNRIVGNDMTDLGAGGVKIGDPKNPANDREATEDNIISDNHIHNIGVVYPAAVGVWVGESSGNTISHNEINDTFYTGISVGWTWGYAHTAARKNLIEFNSIHDIGRGMLSDMGCIYTLGVQPGTVERNNVCHDVSRSRYGGWGLYTDEGSSDIVIEDNVVYRTQDGGFHQHYGANNIVRNNIFAFGQEAQIRRSKLEPHLSFTFEHNIVYWNHGPLFQGVWSDNEYHFDYNLYFRTDGKPIRFADWSFAEWQKRGQDVHSLIQNPLFVDPEHGDFSLKPNSPALKIGFKPISVNQVGPRHR